MNRPLSERSHIPELDGIRGYAIVLVMIYHETTIERTSTLARIIGAIGGSGNMGVDLFFVLSGFLITGILLSSRGRRGYYKDFYARRVLRIFPLYYAVVVVALYVLPHVHNARIARWPKGGDLWYWTYLSNFYIPRRGGFIHGVLDVSWSLSIEEQFYFVWPWTVAFLDRPALKRLCIALLALGPVVRAVCLLAGVSHVAIYTWTFTHMDGLPAGALLAILRREEGGLERYVSAARVTGGVALAVLVAAITGEYFGTSMTWPYLVFGVTELAVLFGAVVLLAVAAPYGSVTRRLARLSWMRMFGRYSYALYLFHNPVQAALRETVLPGLRRVVGSPVATQLVFYVLATAAVLPLAVASFYLFESRWLALKRFFVESQPPRVSTAEA